MFAENSIMWRIFYFAATSVLAPPIMAARVDFARDIQPLLAESCLKCHGPEKEKGGLRLDLKAAVFHGGESGQPGIVPGNPGQSRLFQMVSTTKEDERMPPKGEPLTPDQIALLQRWIAEGAEWPEEATTIPRPGRVAMTVTDADRQHWSFRPLQTGQPPEPKDSSWARSPVDRFIRTAQEARSLSPSAPADSRTLVRRLYFDLVGLPPTPEEMDGWVRRLDLSRESVGALVEELLASPHYGERWARHWLDVARYADSNGMEGDRDRLTAYHFRDFVIRALNSDMPYDQFVRWQLAGDEFAPEKPDAIAATGFLAVGVNAALPEKLLEEEQLRNRADELDDMVSTTSQALLGLTLACARCHDHKYDPLPTRDYYRLMRVFNGGDRAEVPLASPAEVKAKKAALSQWQNEHEAAVKERDQWLKRAREPIAARLRSERIASLPITDEEKLLLSEKPADPAAKKLEERFKKNLRIEDADFVAALSASEQARWRELDGHVTTLLKRKPAPLPTAFAFADFSSEPAETWFFERGDFMARREKMDLGFLTVLTGDKSAQDYWHSAQQARLREDSTQQRRALAEWTTDLEQGAGTLLARVIVNRVWQHHFGEGLVRTASDFGTRGESPTHPELLEWLAGELVRNGWSVKHLHRLILQSATYQQGSRFDHEKARTDPDNRLLWRQHPVRLEAEVLRDSMLLVAGTLNPAMFGPAFKPPIPAEALQARNVKDPYPKDAKDTPETRRRTIYMFHKRVSQYPLMQAFDAPDAQVSCGRRMNTTVAPQALAILNDPFVRLRAGELARRLETEAGSEISAQVRRAYQLCLGREPDPGESASTGAFLAQQIVARAERETKRSKAELQRLALTDFCQTLFGLNEFIYVD